MAAKALLDENPKPTEAGTDLLKVLAVELVKLPNKVAIEGHTDSRPYGRADYSNWELSADRANAAGISFPLAITRGRSGSASSRGISASRTSG